jgi:multidrug efflux system membrane fusion protein
MNIAPTPRGLSDPAFSAVSPCRRLLLLVCILFLLPGCSNGNNEDNKNGQKKRSGIPVSIEISRKETVPLEITATGHVEAFATVDVRSQVTGTLKSVHFKEGDEVKAGAVLFTIDPRPFAANLAKAEADLAKDTAELDNARREGERYALAAQKGFVSVEQANQAATKVATLTATVKADQAMVENARLELEYCTIRAPFAGRTGEIRTDQGNLINANTATPMVTVNQIQPVLATFTVPGRHLKEIGKYQTAGTLKVMIADRSATGEAPTGSLTFIDNTVDPATGVIRLKASFANIDRSLWPGQMVDIRMQLTLRQDCVVVPSQAIQIGQKGAYLYVVKDDRTVEYRPVTPGILFNGETVIESGLQAGERVVTDGQMQLADGVKVEERGKPAADSADAKGKAAGSGNSSGGGTP